MKSRQRLIEEIRTLSAAEVLLMRNWLIEMKREAETAHPTEVRGADRARQALRNLRSPLSEDLTGMRDERQ